MAISYPLTLPAINKIRTFTVRSINAVAYSMSPFTFAGQAHAYAGQRWEIDVTTKPLSIREARQWDAWLTSLRGQYGKFLMGDPMGYTPFGNGGGTPLVAGSDQTGGTLNIDGASTSQTDWLKAGDYIQLGTGEFSTLHKVLLDVDTDGAGAASLELWPHIRTAPSDNSSVIVTNPRGLFRLADSTPSWSTNYDRTVVLSFTAMEAV
jgi:hypothetical protein